MAANKYNADANKINTLIDVIWFGRLPAKNPSNEKNKETENNVISALIKLTSINEAPVTAINTSNDVATPSINRILNCVMSNMFSASLLLRMLKYALNAKISNINNAAYSFLKYNEPPTAFVKIRATYAINAFINANKNDMKSNLKNLAFLNSNA